MLGKEIPELMKMIQKEEAAQNAKEKDTPSIKGVCKFHMIFPFLVKLSFAYSISLVHEKLRKSRIIDICFKNCIL